MAIPNNDSSNNNATSGDFVSVDLSNNNSGALQETATAKESSSTSTNRKCPRGQAFCWSGVNYTAPLQQSSIVPLPRFFRNKNNDTTPTRKTILDNVWGVAHPGQTTAIMGPSGAGKTSLIQALTGRLPVATTTTTSSAGPHLTGDICVGNDRLEASNRQLVRKRVAFVPQFDELFYSDTPRDAIRFSARLRLPRSVSYQEIDELVDHYINKLGLQRCADQLIGGPFFMKQRISGGERRRVSIGIELITNCDTLVLDEPTSGLDSFAALQVMELLRQIAEAGNTVIFTIHQPSSRLFLQFDQVLLLRAGKLLYAGPTKMIADDFASRGVPCPHEINPADWILEVAQEKSEQELLERGFYPAQPQQQNDGEGSRPTNNATDKTLEAEPTAGMIRQTILLAQREFLSVVRVPFLYQVTIFLTIVVAGLSGALFFKIGEKDRESDPFLVGSIFESQLGSVVNAYLIAMSLPGGPALLFFTELRPLFAREYSTGHYSISSFLLGYIIPEFFKTAITLVIQTVILYFMVQYNQSFWNLLSVSFMAMQNGIALAAMVGSSLSDVKLAMAAYPVVLLTQVYFSGVFVSIKLMPNWISWLQYLCSLRFAVNLGLSYEFTNCKPGIDTLLCNAFLELNSIHLSERAIDWMSLALLYLGFRIATYILFHLAIARET